MLTIHQPRRNRSPSRKATARSDSQSAAALGCALFALITGLCAAAPVRALQPLDVFVAQAQQTNPDMRASSATSAQREAEADRATGALLPSLQAQGAYQRNQYEVSIPGELTGRSGNLVVLPHNQLDATFSLQVPLIDVGAWERRMVAKATSEVARADVANTRLELTRRVARAYFQLLASEAVLQAAQRALQLANENVALVVQKRDAGTASELDVQRGRAEVARAEQDVATAKLSVATGRRQLETLSGLSPEPALEFPSDDLGPEQPLAAWQGKLGEVPAVQSANAAKKAAELGARAANSAWLPTIQGTAQERLTNAPALAANNYYYMVQVSALWRIDATIPANVRALRAQAEVAMARADATRRQVDDALFQDWHQVEASIERARAARVQVEAASAAATLARDRYEGGIATQLEVLQAQQDLFRADVGRIQADADLSYARVSLRLDAAQPIGDRR